MTINQLKEINKKQKELFESSSLEDDNFGFYFYDECIESMFKGEKSESEISKDK